MFFRHAFYLCNNIAFGHSAIVGGDDPAGLTAERPQLTAEFIAEWEATDVGVIV